VGRVLGAVLISLGVTAAVAVPMAYQAGSARDRATDTTPGPSGGVSEPSVPAQVAGITLTREQLLAEPARITTTLPPANVLVSDDGVDRGLEPLDGARLQDPTVWIVVDRPDAVVVRFWLNEPAGTTAPDRVDELAPFTASGPDEREPAPVDTGRLATGTNTVLVEITTSAGAVEHQLATFRVG
jgi:hypothetical protein